MRTIAKSESNLPPFTRFFCTVGALIGFGLIGYGVVNCIRIAVRPSHLAFVPVTSQQKAEGLMRDLFGPNLYSVKVSQEPCMVEVVFKANETFPGKSRWSTEEKMIRAYKAIYTSGLRVVEASMAAHEDTIDRFGREADTLVYVTNLNSETAAQINWNNAEMLNFNRLWQVGWIHPAMRGQEQFNESTP